MSCPIASKGVVVPPVESRTPYSATSCSAVGVELEDEAGGLEEAAPAVWLALAPRRLHAESRLEVGLRRLGRTQHENRAPLRHRHAGHEPAHVRVIEPGLPALSALAIARSTGGFAAAPCPARAPAGPPPKGLVPSRVRHGLSALRNWSSVHVDHPHLGACEQERMQGYRGPNRGLGALIAPRAPLR
jgi:hypothetical protein